MKLDEIIPGQEYMVQELGKVRIPDPDALTGYRHLPGWPFDYYTRVTVLGVREPFKARRDGVRIQYSYKRARRLPPNVGIGLEVDPATGEAIEDTLTAEAVVHYSKISKPWAEHELHMAIWRWERDQQLKERGR